MEPPLVVSTHDDGVDLNYKGGSGTGDQSKPEIQGWYFFLKATIGFLHITMPSVPLNPDASRRTRHILIKVLNLRGHSITVVSSLIKSGKKLAGVSDICFRIVLDLDEHL